MVQIAKSSKDNIKPLNSEGILELMKDTLRLYTEVDVKMD